MDLADLELTLRRQSDGVISADLRLRSPDGSRDADLALGVPVDLRPAELRPLARDPEAYGRALTAQLFHEAHLREGWLRAAAFAQGAGTAMRVRLRLDPSADELHTLRWETLRDPAADRALARSEQVIFSRYLDSDDLGRGARPGRPELRVVAAIANPPELAEYGLAPLDSAAERAQLVQALGATPLRVLGREGGPQPASLGAIVAALREGHGILYLVCHGAMVDGRSYLWLERDEGARGPVAGAELVRAIADLPHARRPHLVVLASCASAGDGHDALTALGPALARGGVAAVVAMQGRLPIAMARHLLPAFFRALLEDGLIDRALAAARAALPDEHPWWMPVLLMGVRDGRIWAEGSAAEADVGASLSALADLARDEHVRATMVAFSTSFQAARDQINLLSGYKQIHDALQQLEDAYHVMAPHARRLSADETAWGDLEEQAPELGALIAELLQVGGQAGPSAAEGLWLQRLERGRADLEAAIERRDAALARQGLAQVARVLGRELSRMNAALVTTARGLNLQQLIAALSAIRDQLAPSRLSTAARSQLTIFADGVSEMARLNARLGVLVATHDAFQEVDDELRRVKELIAQDVGELILAWADISRLARRLYEVNPEEWASRLSAHCQLLDAAVAANEPLQIRRAFRTFHHQALRSFHKVDQDLLSLCSELQAIGRPTEAVLKLLA